ncbi:hypothetical protein ACMFMF_002779 [Clarireedia jacksonii]
MVVLQKVMPSSHGVKSSPTRTAQLFAAYAAAHSQLSDYVTTLTYNDAVMLDGPLPDEDVLEPVELLAFNLAIKRLRHRIKTLEIIMSRPASARTHALFHSDVVLSLSTFINNIRAHTALVLDIQLYIQAWKGPIEQTGGSIASVDDQPVE